MDVIEQFLPVLHDEVRHSLALPLVLEGIVESAQLPDLLLELRDAFL
jgi:hypothetical protein